MITRSAACSSSRWSKHRDRSLRDEISPDSEHQAKNYLLITILIQIFRRNARPPN